MRRPKSNHVTMVIREALHPRSVEPCVLTLSEAAGQLQALPLVLVRRGKAIPELTQRPLNIQASQGISFAIWGPWGRIGV